MFLYRQTSKHSDMVLLTEDFDSAVERARAFIGEHNPIDGCSTPPAIEMSANRFYGQRHSSFGLRKAWVISINTNELTAI